MRVSGEQRPEFFGFVNAALGGAFEHGPFCKVITCLANDGRILAAVVYDNITRYDAQMSVASDGSRHWICRGFLHDVFRYPFLQVGLQRLTVVASEDNGSALEMNLRLGFQCEGRLRRYFGETDGIVLGMLRSECRYLGVRHG